MKAILLHANEDLGFEARLEAALAIARAFGGRLTCLHVTPFNAFIMGDPFGGVHALPVLMEKAREAEEEHRARVEQRLRSKGVDWCWLSHDGMPAQILAAKSRLCDLIVTSRPFADYDGPLSITADTAVHTRTPVLAVPPGLRAFDCSAKSMVAWNDSPEAAAALRLSRPLIALGGKVELVAVTEDDDDCAGDGPCRYLRLHGINSTLSDWPRGKGKIADDLIEAADSLGAGYIVMGAYGHTRIGEAVLGGVTRDMLRSSPLPLLMAH